MQMASRRFPKATKGPHLTLLLQHEPPATPALMLQIQQESKQGMRMNISEVVRKSSVMVCAEPACCNTRPHRALNSLGLPSCQCAVNTASNNLVMQLILLEVACND